MAERTAPIGEGAGANALAALLASRLQTLPLQRNEEQAKQHMAQTLTSGTDIDVLCPDTPMIGLVVRVWRSVAGAPVGLFTYAGEADAAVLPAVMQVVQRLTAAAPGEWRVEIVAAGLESSLMRLLERALGDLRRRGLRPRLALSPRLRPELRALLNARSAAAAPLALEPQH